MSDTCTASDIDKFLTNAAWAIRSTYHTVLRSSPGAAVFGRDMLFDIPYLADWTEIGKRRQLLVNQDCERKNSRRIDFDYTVGQQVLLKKMVSSAKQKTKMMALTSLHKCTLTAQSGFNTVQFQKD